MTTAFPIHGARAARTVAMDPGPALKDLRAPIPDTPRPQVFTTFFAALITFGLYPAIIWPLRFRRVIDAERLRLGRVAQWLEARAAFDKFTEGRPDSTRLRLAADAIRFRPLLYLLGFATCAAWVILFFSCGGRLEPHNPLLVRGTYWFHSALSDSGESVRLLVHFGAHAPPWALRTSLFVFWVSGLSFAFLTHWLQVQLHSRSVRRFLDPFNKIAIHEGLSPVLLAPAGLGLGPLWIIGAIAMIRLNAPWGIPLMLAGAVHRRYVARIGPEMRSAVASRVRDMTLLPRPLITPAPPPPPPSPGPTHAAAAINARPRCATEGCRLSLSAGARFCPRCGRRTAPRVDRVA